MGIHWFTATRLWCDDCENVWFGRNGYKDLDAHTQSAHGGRRPTRDERTPR